MWNKNCFGHVRNSLNRKLKELQEAEEGGSYRTNPRRIYKLREEIQRLKNKEECMWKQHSWNIWLKKEIVTLGFSIVGQIKGITVISFLV